MPLLTSNGFFMLNNNDLHYDLLQSELSNLFDSQELQLLLKRNHILTYAAGETILQQGKLADGIYLIISGTVLITAKLLGEGTTNLETLSQGDFIGEISFFENIPCATSVIAASNAQCILLSKMYLEFLSAYFPETKYKLSHAISKQVCTRLKKMHEKITTFIRNSDMTSQSLFSEILHSFTKPSEIKLAEAHVDINKLHRSVFFHTFSEHELETLMQRSIVLNAAKNCDLLTKNDKKPTCYIVIHGAVQTSIIHDNKVAKLSVIGPDILFANIACMEQNPSFNINFTTCEQAIVLKLVDTELLNLQHNFSELWFKVFDLICRSLIALEKSVDKLDIRLNIEMYNRK